MKPRRRQKDSKNGVNITRTVTRSMTTHHRNSLTLPDDVLTEIFSRLSLKSIARCRCVSKLWSSMLRRQDFTELFFTKSCARLPQLLFACEDDNEFLYEKKDDNKFLFFSSPQPQNPDDNSHVVAVHNLARFPSSYELFGCTNGFLCYGSNLMLKVTEKPVYVTVICNPSTGQSLTLPRLNSKIKYGVESYLGYDPFSKEFKVLCSRYDGWISKDHHVLTLGTKKLSWRVVECCVPYCSYRKWICISGVLYYTARTSVDYIVVCFDMRTEKFSFVKFSRGLPGSTPLINYNGRLGLLMSEASCYVGRSSKSFELWVLRDAAKHEWSSHVYMLPVFWKDVV